MSILSLVFTNIAPWIILGAFVVTLLRAVYDSFLSPLAKIPSIHWSANWTRCHILCTKYFSSVRHAHYAAHLNLSGGGNFRPLVRTGPNEVSVMTTDGIQTVFGGGFDRSPWYNVFSNFGLVETTFFRVLCLTNIGVKTCSPWAQNRAMLNGGVSLLRLTRKHPYHTFMCNTS